MNTADAAAPTRLQMASMATGLAVLIVGILYVNGIKVLPESLYMDAAFCAMPGILTGVDRFLRRRRRKAAAH